MTREWDAAGDKDTRDSHSAMDGQKRGLDEPFTTGDGWQLMHPGDGSLGAPAEEVINCFPPWSLVGLTGLTGAMSRHYSGDLVELSVAGEVDVTFTVNHPVLTRRGWVPAGDVVEGDDLLQCSDSRFHGPWQPEVADRVSRADNLYDATKSLGYAMRAHRDVVNLHGEMSDHDVYIVTFDRSLRDVWQALGNEIFGDLTLAETDVSLVSFGGFGGSFLRYGVSTHQADGVVCCTRPGESLFGRHKCGGAPIALGHTGSLDTKVKEATVDNRPADTELLGDCINRETIVEKLCDAGMMGGSLGGMPEVSDLPLWASLVDRGFTVVRVDCVHRRHYDGPVYNFESETGLLVVSGIVNHNCRCSVQVSIDFLSDLGPGD